MPSLKTMRDQHGQLVTEARAILTANPGAMQKEDEAKFDKLMADADALEARILAEQRTAEAEKRMLEKTQGNSGINEVAGAGSEDYSKVFRSFVRHGNKGLNPEQRKLIEERSQEFRAQGVSNGVPPGALGGYAVAEDFSDAIELAMRAYGGMVDFENVDTITTSTGATMPYPTSNDTGTKGGLLAENTSIGGEVDIPFSVVNLNAYMYTSRLILASYQLIQDFAFNLDGFIQSRAAERLGRILNEHFTLGTGSGQPHGVVNAATLGVTGSTQFTLSYDNFVDLEHSVDPAYRNNPKSIFMFNDNVLKVVRKIKDSTGRPLIWNQDNNLGSGVVQSIFGHRYVINQDMANLGAESKSVLFGDFSKYKVRKVKEYSLVRLTERFADYLQVGFFIFCRFDGRLIDAGTNPIKYLQQAAASP